MRFESSCEDHDELVVSDLVKLGAGRGWCSRVNLAGDEESEPSHRLKEDGQQAGEASHAFS